MGEHITRYIYSPLARGRYYPTMTRQTFREFQVLAKMKDAFVKVVDGDTNRVYGVVYPNGDCHAWSDNTLTRGRRFLAFLFADRADYMDGHENRQEYRHFLQRIAARRHAYQEQIGA